MCDLLGYRKWKYRDDFFFTKEMYVVLETRRSGIARELIQFFEKWVLSRDQKIACVSIAPHNTAMLNLLRSEGYDILNTIELRKNLSSDNHTPRSEIEVFGHKWKVLWRYADTHYNSLLFSSDLLFDILFVRASFGHARYRIQFRHIVSSLSSHRDQINRLAKWDGSSVHSLVCVASRNKRAWTSIPGKVTQLQLVDYQDSTARDTKNGTLLNRHSYFAIWDTFGPSFTY